MDADLVLEGGGVKGIGLVGALKVFGVAGTSAGAIVGSLAAAGVPPDQLQRIMQELDYRKFQDGDFLSHLGAPGAALQVLLHKGIYKGDWLHDWVADRLADVGAGQVDEMPVADAVRASASIPFFFQPCMLKVPGRGGQVYLTDGGMLSNFPIDVFDRRDDQRPRWPTFGVKLSAKPNANLMAPAPSIRGVVRFGLALVATMTNAHDQMHLDEPSVVDRTVFVDTFGVKATDFDLDAKTRDQLFDKGTAAGKKFLDGWNFDRYLDTYWRPTSAAAAST